MKSGTIKYGHDSKCFSGYVFESDFHSCPPYSQRKSLWADRIVADGRFDESCKKLNTQRTYIQEHQELSSFRWWSLGFTKHDYGFFEKARQVALFSDFTKIHIGCVAVYRGQVIGIGCNTNKTHPMQAKYNRLRDSDACRTWREHSVHAEIACLNQIRHMDVKWSKVKLYIYRLRKDGKFGMCRPCVACMAAIKDIGIKNIYYTSDSGYAQECLV